MLNINLSPSDLIALLVGHFFLLSLIIHFLQDVSLPLRLWPPPSYKSSSLSSGYPSALGSSVLDSGSGLGRDMDREMAAMKREMDRDFGVTVSYDVNMAVINIP